MKYWIFLLLAFTIASCGDDDVSGCTNPASDNYNAEANVDDGSCIISGCTDPDADNYNAQATDSDGSCIFSGCTDPNASNYDPNATVDSGNCLYPGCTDNQSDQYNADANDDDGSCETYFNRWTGTFAGDFTCEALLEQFFGDASMTFTRLDIPDNKDSMEVFITFSLSEFPLNFNSQITRDSMYTNAFFPDYTYEGDLKAFDGKTFDVTVGGVLGINESNDNINGVLTLGLVEKEFQIEYTEKCIFNGDLQ